MSLSIPVWLFCEPTSLQTYVRRGCPAKRGFIFKRGFELPYNADNTSVVQLRVRPKGPGLSIIPPLLSQIMCHSATIQVKEHWLKKLGRWLIAYRPLVSRGRCVRSRYRVETRRSHCFFRWERPTWAIATAS